jgi:hypothetical protein
MAGDSEACRNPYPGPRAFEEEEQDLFFGRDQEVEILAGLVMARRASLLFAQSGAGKSSLLKAGLVPELTHAETVGRGPRARTYQKMHVLPILTVGGPLPAALDRPIANVYVFSALSALLSEAGAGDLAPLALADALAPLFPAADPADAAVPGLPGAPTATLLIFDQFEELFTYHPAHRQEREGFFRQVAEALEAHDTLHVLFSMREDYIGELTPYAALLPEQLRPRFRLEFLDEGKARLAIRRPAAAQGVEVSEEATTRLVNDLRRVRLLRRDGTRVEEPGPYVEPVQLQVVCHRLWEELPAGATRIAEADIEAVGDVDSALTDYYARQVAAVAATSGCSERAIRDWIDRQLITEQGIRGQVLQGPEESQGLPNEAIWPLVDAHLVRAEVRRGATWFELAHDRLIEPVRRDNARWRDASLNTLQRQAGLWNSAQRPDGLLLRGPELAEAERWAEAHGPELEAFERDFLARSQERHKVERRQRILAVGLAVMFVLALVAAVFSGVQWGDARRQQGKAVAAQYTAVAAVNAMGTADSKAGEVEQEAAAYQTVAAGAQASADRAQALANRSRETAEAVGTAMTMTLEELQTVQVQERTAVAAQATADHLRGTAEAAGLEALIAQQTAQVERETAVAAVATLQATPLPGDTPTPTPTPSETPTAAATRRPSATPRPRPTTPAPVVCDDEPVGIFAPNWQTYRNRLGCPLQVEPIQFVDTAEEHFEHGFMFWSAYTGRSGGLMLVLSSGAAPRWYEPGNWSFDPDGAWCEADFPAPSGLIMPKRGFGGVWCDRKEIREALGWATDQEHNVNGVVQGFEHGFIFRGGDPKVFYILFRDDSTYVRKVNP